jgi:hypothetical protein
MSIFTFISRTLRVIGRPRHIIFPPRQPSNLSWKKPRFLQPKIKRTTINVLRFARRHYVIPFVAQPALVFKRFPRPWKRRPPLKVVHHRVIFPPAKPSNLSWLKPRFLRPRIKRQGRNVLWFARRHYPIAPSPSIPFKKILRPWKRRPPLKVVHHKTIFPPQKPSNLSWVKPRFLRPKIKRPVINVLKTARRRYVIPAVIGTAFVFKRFPKPWKRRQPLKVIHHRTIFPPNRPSNLSWIRPRYLRPRIKRGRNSTMWFARRRYVIPGAAPPPPSIMVLQRTWRVFLDR